MRRTIVAAVIALGAVVAARVAAADVFASGELAVVPSGRLVLSGDGQAVGVGLDATGGIAGAVGVRFGRLSVALAPRYLPSMTPHYLGMGAFGELDVGARVAGHLPAARTVELVGFVTPGYSILFQDDTSSGLVVAVGGGATFRIRRGLRLDVTMAYQHGDQHVGASGEGAATRLVVLGTALTVTSR